MKLPIYIISLARDHQRRRRILEQFSSIGIDYYFFDAVDAKEPSNKDVLEYMKRSGMGGEMTDGETACTLSHQLIYQDMLSRGFEWSIILEDDVIVDTRLKEFIESFTDKEQSKLNKNNLYLLGGQEGLHKYPVLGLSRISKLNVGSCCFRRVNYNAEKIRRASSYLMSDLMARKLLELTEIYGTYRADAWFFAHEKSVIDDFYLDEIIRHPIVSDNNSHLELERRLVSKQKIPRSNLQLKLKWLRSWIRVTFFSFFK